MLKTYTSRFLPYFVYDEINGLFYNKDNSTGFLFQININKNNQYSRLKNFVNFLLDNINSTDIIIGLHYFSLSYNTEDIIEKFYNKKLNIAGNFSEEEFLRVYSLFLNKSIYHINYQYLIKNPTLIVSVLFQNNGQKNQKKVNEFKQQCIDFLKQEEIEYKEVVPFLLIKIVQYLFYNKILSKGWEFNRFLSDQILKDNKVRYLNDKSRIYIGNKKFTYLTFKNLSDKLELSLFDYFFLNNNLSQFLFSINIKLKDTIKDKTFYFLPIICFHDLKENNLKMTVDTIKSVFSNFGNSIQEEKAFIPVMFLMSLPMGFSFSSTDIEAIKRYFLIGRNNILEKLFKSSYFLKSNVNINNFLEEGNYEKNNNFLFDNITYSDTGGSGRVGGRLV